VDPSDKLNELFANGNEFTLHRLLSDIGVNDMNIDMNELVKFDPMKLLDTRSISEFVSGKKLCSFFFEITKLLITEKKEIFYLNYLFLFYLVSI
jgi:hypothetical protein